MQREIRIFNAWDGEGRLFILIEAAPHARDVRGELVRAGPPTVETLTGLEAKPLSEPG